MVAGSGGAWVHRHGRWSSSTWEERPGHCGERNEPEHGIDLLRLLIFDHSCGGGGALGKEGKRLVRRPRRGPGCARTRVRDDCFASRVLYAIGPLQSIPWGTDVSRDTRRSSGAVQIRTESADNVRQKLTLGRKGRRRCATLLPAPMGRRTAVWATARVSLAANIPAVLGRRRWRVWRCAFEVRSGKVHRIETPRPLAASVARTCDRRGRIYAGRLPGNTHDWFTAPLSTGVDVVPQGLTRNRCIDCYPRAGPSPVGLPRERVRHLRLRSMSVGKLAWSSEAVTSTVESLALPMTPCPWSAALRSSRGDQFG